MATRLDEILRRLDEVSKRSAIAALIAGTATGVLAGAVTAWMMLHSGSTTNDIPALTAQIGELGSELSNLRTAIEAQTRLAEQQHIAARTEGLESARFQDQIAAGFTAAYASRGVPEADARIMGEAASKELMKAAIADPVGTIGELASVIKRESPPSTFAGTALGKAWEVGRNAAGKSSAAIAEAKDGFDFIAEHLVKKLIDVPIDAGASVLEEWLKKMIFGEPDKDANCCCDSKSSASGGGSSSASSSGTSCIPTPTDYPVLGTGSEFQLAGSLYFDSNRFQSWQPEGKDTWNRLKKTAQASTSEFVLLRAITDTQASAAHNLWLAEKRGATVRAELIKAGVPQHRIFVAVNGESEAGLKVRTQDGKREQANRVVDVFLERKN